MENNETFETRTEKYEKYYNYNKKRKKKRRIKYKNVFILILFLIFLTIFIISLIKIITWKKDTDNTEEQIKEINKSVTVVEKEDNQNVEIIENDVPESNMYWDYIKMNLIDVNFDELKKINNEAVGWIQVNGTNINYPIVKHSNNKYYLTHSFDKSYNNAGWVFMDYRNNINEFDKNTIIYAHGMINNIMFGSLRKILTNGWLNDKNNYIVKLSTEKENTLWQVFSVYKIPTTNDYLKINFEYEDNFIKLANTLIQRSDYNFDTTINANDKILTLSTCYDNNDKVVLHAKLIKIERKQ